MRVVGKQQRARGRKLSITEPDDFALVALDSCRVEEEVRRWEESERMRREWR